MFFLRKPGKYNFTLLFAHSVLSEEPRELTCNCKTDHYLSRILIGINLPITTLFLAALTSPADLASAEVPTNQ